MRKLALHWQILIAMALGIGYGLIAAQTGSTQHVDDWIKPFGTLFLNLLKMIAVPLVLFSLVAGVASLDDTSKIGRIGGKTIALYLATTAIAITIGLVVVNIFRPGSGISAELRESLRSGFAQMAEDKVRAAEDVSIVQQLIGIVPTNPFAALANSEMLQIVFFALMLGVALTRLNSKRPVAHVVSVFQLLSDGIIEMVHLIMKIAPIGVFAMLASVLADLGEDPEQTGQLLGALLGYMGTVVLALVLHGVLVYGLLIRGMARIPVKRFAKAMLPAQLLAFSSSSSAATLPVTIDCVEKGVGVDEEASSFVLPLGATINMDGTGLYQGVAAVFIATVYGMDLSLLQQAEIVLTATLASIGTAAVPGVGIVMLTIVLKQVGVPLEGIALILGVDRPLDMCRTVLNVTGDATVCTVVARSEGLLHEGERHHV
ncbi:MAG: dicarboxylate/amino acid:cation symporter [Planctomycetota bacterium]